MADKTPDAGPDTTGETGPDAGPKIDAMSFEDALAELERVVDALEGGEVPLDRSIALYERGEQLRAHCEKKLADAELKVEKIVQGRNGAQGREPFDAG